MSRPIPSEPHDSELVAELGRRDEMALGVIYDRHAGMVYGLARSIVGSEVEAEEVAEDVFLYLWREPGSWDPGRGSLATYLAVVTRSRALDRVRARRRRAAAEGRAAAKNQEGVAVDLSGGDPPERRAELAETRARLDSALRELNDGQRRAIELAYFEGLTQSEIARRTDTPLGTVKTRIRDGMIKLREIFGDSGRAKA